MALEEILADDIPPQLLLLVAGGDQAEPGIPMDHLAPLAITADVADDGGQTLQRQRVRVGDVIDGGPLSLDGRVGGEVVDGRGEVVDGDEVDGELDRRGAEFGHGPGFDHRLDHAPEEVVGWLGHFGQCAGRDGGGAIDGDGEAAVGGLVEEHLGDPASLEVALVGCLLR